MKQALKKEHVAEKEGTQKKLAYQSPAIIYEGMITTRAGSPIGFGGDGEDSVDPANLFGND